LSPRCFQLEDGSFELFSRGERVTLHSLDESPHVIDVRNIGLVGAIELDSVPGAPGKRAFDVFRACFERGVLIRTTGDIIALSPPLIVQETHIDQAISTIADVLKTVA
jgi:beta-alanine--pyruvate transaminase